MQQSQVLLELRSLGHCPALREIVERKEAVLRIQEFSNLGNEFLRGLSEVLGYYHLICMGF